MTNQEIFELLINIDNGYKLTRKEYKQLSYITSITWRIVQELPYSMCLLKNLIKLDLKNTKVSDISALYGLIALTDLDLQSTPVENIDALASLTKLRELNLSHTRIDSIEVLSQLNYITNLNLSDTELVDISALADLIGLTNLDLSDNPSLYDLDPLYGLSGLVSLNLSNTFPLFITPLSSLYCLRNLNLGNTSVDDISALSGLTMLTNLDLSRTNVSDISALSGLTSLTKLDLSDTGIRDISALSRLTELTNLNLSGGFFRSDLSDISALSGLTTLTNLDLSRTNVSDISALSGLTSLTNLNLSKTDVYDISALSNLTALTNLDISSIAVSDISILSNLTALTTLDLRHLKLNVIPEWLLELDLDFILESNPKGKGIYIYDLKLTEQPIEIFSQESELIRAYYRSQDKVPINECKVIFLGDAEAGKTHSIRRLLKNGEKLTDFDGNSTPGIDITISSTKIEETDIVVNYWDFGGQEIQHSMHRMFLTERTVYVVFLNARQDPLDERARYWIENINSFASGAPILLVINKIDQNDRPKFNEDGIRAAYKDQIKDIVRMSALNDDPKIFLEELEGSINKIIKELPTASTMVPKAWKSLMEDLRSTSKHYLTTDEFKEKCELYYVNNYDKIHNALVNLFQDIGVSFCYYKDRSIADYMLLNPKWLVNALYTIVTNSKDITQNGIIKQADLYDVLKEDIIKGTPIRRVIPDWRYEGIQVNYILGVIRMFRLSYQLKDGSEFFPMLCDGNEKISVSKAVSSNALHYIFQYTYLPANVLHRLIVEKQRELDYNYVWYSGAVFRNGAQAQIAYVHTIGNNLHIYVDCLDSFYNPNEYLTPLINEVRGINQDMGLQAEELIGIKIKGENAEISYDSLIGNLKTGNKYFYVSKKIGAIDIGRILFRYNDYRPTGDGKLISIVIDSLLDMIDEPVYYEADENARNRFISLQLRRAGYYCGDQVPGGLSATGKSIGARDGVIKDKNKHDICIFEGLNLNSLVKATINLHLNKLLINYNPQGLPYGLMLVYLNCARNKYKEFIDKYINYINDYAPDTFICISSPSIEWTSSNGQFLTCIKMCYECGGYYYTIYHIVVRIAA